MYPPFLTSTLASKRTMLTKIWKVLLKKSIHRLLRDFHITRSLSLLRKSSWHLQPPSQRSVLTPGSSIRAFISAHPSRLTSTRRGHIGRSCHCMFYLCPGSQFCQLHPYFL